MGSRDESTALGRGAQRALACAFSEHERAIRRYLTARTGADSADDLISTVFECAARTLVRNPDQELSRAWLFTVARRRLVDQWRREGRHRDALTRLGQDGGNLDDPGHRVAHRLDLADSLSRVGDRQRLAILLRYYGGIPTKEAADALHTSDGALESLTRRARSSMQADLGPTYLNA